MEVDFNKVITINIKADFKPIRDMIIIRKIENFATELNVVGAMFGSQDYARSLNLKIPFPYVIEHYQDLKNSTLQIRALKFYNKIFFLNEI